MQVPIEEQVAVGSQTVPAQHDCGPNRNRIRPGPAIATSRLRAAARDANRGSCREAALLDVVPSDRGHAGAARGRQDISASGGAESLHADSAPLEVRSISRQPFLRPTPRAPDAGLSGTSLKLSAVGRFEEGLPPVDGDPPQTQILRSS